MKAAAGANAARRCSSAGGAWLALAFCRVPEGVDHVLHCLARHVGISFGMGCLSDSAWLALRRPGQDAGDGRGASASGPGYRREVSSVTMSAADCDCLASATPCPAHIESASISPVVPAIGGAGS